MKRPSKKTLVSIAIFLAGALLIFEFLPRPDRATLSYEVNRPWSHDQLLAPFDIPVYRDSLTMQQMEDSIRAHFVPVYRIDETPLQRLSTAINSSDRFSPSDRVLLIATLTRIYDNGVIDQQLADRIAGGLTEVKINQGNNSTTTRSVGRMRSSLRAYNLLDSLIGRRNPKLMSNLRLLGLNSMLTPNYVEDTDESNRLLAEFTSPVWSAYELIQKGQSIITRGQMVTPELYQVLRSYENESARRAEKEGSSDFNITIGQLAFSLAVMAMLYIFLLLYNRSVIDDARRLTCLIILLAGFFIFAVFMNNTFSSGLYIVPFAILPILLMVFYDVKTALFCMVLETLACASFASYTFEFVLIELSAGLTAVFSLRELSRRSQLLRSSFFVFLAYVFSYVTVELMQVATLNAFSWKLIGFFALNMVLTSFAYILIFVLEKVFGFTSAVTLVELSDINNHVLRELSEECPGTFQHSMAVSNLASDAARRIGANLQLVRAGALYHDIGKIRNPAFFTENQHGVNPHDTLDPKQSARVIISHVTDGLRRAEKAKLPKVIRDMISQHHGKSTARYFLTTYCNAHPDEQVDPAPFTYPGPNPQSKEASLLMMADVVEAASRSLPDHKPETISNMVNTLIDKQVMDGLHNESPISFRDITTIKQAFIDRLRTMYHVRVSYPKDTRTTTQTEIVNK